MGRKTTKDIKVIGGKPLPKPPSVSTVSFNDVIDHNGRKYVYNPLAKLPYSRHSILYPSGCGVGDEDIPMQHGHESNVGVNGASPYLLMAASHTALTNSTSRLPFREIATAHLQMALELLKAEEDFLTELQKIEDPAIRNTNEVLVLAAAHLVGTYENKSPNLRAVVCNVLQEAESTAVNMIAIPPKTADNYRKIINMVQKPVR